MDWKTYASEYNSSKGTQKSVPVSGKKGTEVGRTLKSAGKQLLQSGTGLKKFVDDTLESGLYKENTLVDKIFSKSPLLSSQYDKAVSGAKQGWLNREQVITSRLNKRQASIDDISKDLYINKKSFGQAVKDVDLKYIGLAALSQAPQIALTAAATATTGPYGALALNTGVFTGGEYNKLSDTAQEFGQEVDKKTRRLSLSSGTIQALAEMVPFLKYTGKSGLAQSLLKKELTESLSKKSARFLLRANEEGMTEALQQFTANAFEKVYNKNKNLYDGLLENYIAGNIIGNVFDGVFQATGLGINHFKDTKSGGEIVTNIQDYTNQYNKELETGTINPVTVSALNLEKQKMDLYEQVNKQNVLNIETDSFISNINILPITVNGKEMYQAEVTLAPVNGEMIPPIKTEFFETEQQAFDSLKEIAPQEVIDNPQFKKVIDGMDETYQDEGDLSTTILRDLKGKTTVSKQYILDATNRGELKQVERDLTRQILDTMPEGQVNVKEFADKVKAELLPLKRNNDPYKYRGKFTSNRYEQVSLPDELRGDVKDYAENIYESPIKTSAGNTHFPEATENYFGHTRIEDMSDNKTRRVIEVQSDLYQKGNLEREVADRFDPAKTQLPKDRADKLFNYTKRLSGQGENLSTKEITEYRKLFDDAKTLHENTVVASRNKELSKLQQYNDPTAHFRMIREEIKKASQDGKTKLQFPTGETAMNIEGLGNPTLWTLAENTDMRLMPDTLKVGREIVESRAGQGGEELGDSWIITEVLDNGKFKAVPRNNIDFVEDQLVEIGYQYPDDAIKAIAQGDKRVIDLLEDGQGSEQFDISGKVDTNNPIYRFYEKDVTKYLNKFGGKKVVDDKGVSWIEIPITAEQGINPVPAFKQTTSETLRENLTPKEKELLNKEVSFKEVLPELNNLLNKIGVQTTVNIFDNIYTGGKNKDMTPEQAFGMYFDKELSLASRTTMFIHNHEVSHMVLENMDNMQIFKDKEITQSDVFNALREEYGNQSKAELDEILAVLVEKDAMNRYLKRKSDTRGVIKKYIDALLDFISDFLGNSKNLTVLEKYIEVINGDKNYKTNKVKLSGTGKSAKYSIKPTEIQQDNALFKSIESTNLNQIKDFLKKTIDNTIRKYAKENGINKVETDELKSNLYKLSDSIKTEQGVFNVLAELRNYEVKQKLKVQTDGEKIRKVTMLQTLKDLYRLDPVIIKDIKKSKGITGNIQDMTITQIESFVEEAKKRYEFAEKNGYFALPTRDVVVGSFAKITKGKQTKAFSKEAKSGVKKYAQLLQDRVTGKIKELFGSYEFDNNKINEKYKKLSVPYTTLLDDLYKHKITNEQQAVLNSRFGDGKDNVELRGIIHAIHINLFYPGQTDTKYADMLYDLGDILGYDIRNSYSQLKELVFDSIHADSISQNIGVNYVGMYFPRIVRNDVPREDYIAAVKRQLEKKYRVPYEQLSQDIKDKFVNNIVTRDSAKLKSSGISAMESPRELGEITDIGLLNMFQEPIEAIDSYINRSTTAYLRKKYFNVDTEKQDGVDELGRVISQLIDNNTITNAEIAEVINVYNAYFSKDDSSVLAQRYCTLVYVIAMNKFTSAITQLGEVIPTIWNTGIQGNPFDTRIKPVDIGAETDTVLKQELLNNDKFSQFLLKHISLSDTPGFVLLINNSAKGVLSAVKSYKKGNSYNKNYIQKIHDIYGVNAPAVINKLSQFNYSSTEPVPVELLRITRSVVGDYRTLGRLQKTESAVRNPGFWVLKNFMMSTLNILYRNGISPMAEGYKTKDVKKFSSGLKNTIGLLSAYGTSTYLTGMLIDLIVGNERDDEVKEFLFSVLGVFGINRYTGYVFERQGFGASVLNIATPASATVPLGWASNVIKTIEAAIDGDNDYKSVKDLPWVGNIIYNRTKE
jgi:hypothetical protein